MKSYKEIVTKAIIGKGKKLFKNRYDLTLEDKIDTVLGAWVINHVMVSSDNFCLNFFKKNYMIMDINGDFKPNCILKSPFLFV